MNQTINACIVISGHWDRLLGIIVHHCVQSANKTLGLISSIFRQNRGRPPNPIPNPISNPKFYPNPITNPIPNPKPYPNPKPNPKPNHKCYRNRVRWSPTVLPHIYM